MELQLLGNIVVIFVLSVFVLLVFHRMKAPAIVGFLMTGIVAGPHGFGLISAVAEVDALAEIGVILLLFTIGIEMSLKDILKIKKYVLVGGSLQLIFTTGLVYLVLNAFGFPPGESILIGFLISLSSTAIVLRILQNRAEFDSLYGRTTLGILIFQDIAIVPMMLLTPLLPGAANVTTESPLTIAVRAAVLISIVIVCAKWLVPGIFYQIARTGDRELFLLSLVAICFAIAWATSIAGLSLGLGAFLAGLIISESPYSNQAIGNVLPLRDAFTSFFFVSIGMLLDLNYIIQNPGLILLLAFGVMALKAVAAGLAISIIGLPIRIVVLVSLALSQIGEFSFVLSKTGVDIGLMPKDAYQMFIAVSVITMAATSIIISLSPKAADTMMKLPFARRLGSKGQAANIAVYEPMSDHLIIVGYGVNGRNVATSARSEGIPYVIIETDPEIVKEEKANCEPISYGDATQDEVLLHAGVKRARIMVIAISDPGATRRITDSARRLNNHLYIIARTRYIQEMKPLKEIGADQVIPEEYETSVEIFSRVLERYEIPTERIKGITENIRSDGYQMFRSLSVEPFCTSSISMISNDVITYRVGNGSPGVGMTIADLGLKEAGVALLAVHRGEETTAEPDMNMPLQPDDVIVLLGSVTRAARIGNLFKAGQDSASG
jgi:CPA2 family monovalent cation:H+ antiporter-2